MSQQTTSAMLVDERVAMWAASVTIPRMRAEPDEVADLRLQVERELPRITEAATAWTQMSADISIDHVRVVGRAAWVRANLRVVAGLLEPLRDRLDKSGAAQVLGAQLGALLGVLSSRVLGQFVLPTAHNDETHGQLLVVGPNVVELGRTHGKLADDIRRTVMLHEVAHWLQFAHAPWLAVHLQTLIDEYLDDVSVDGSAMSRLAGRLPAVVADIRKHKTIEPLITSLMTERQKLTMERAQAMMSLLEGHGNVAMTEAAPDDVVPSRDEVREVLERRRQDISSKLLAMFAGLDIKRRQYRDGEAFVRAVVDEAGVSELNRAFDRPEALPSLAEIGEPQQWLRRIRSG